MLLKLSSFLHRQLLNRMNAKNAAKFHTICYWFHLESYFLSDTVGGTLISLLTGLQISFLGGSFWGSFLNKINPFSAVWVSVCSNCCYCVFTSGSLYVFLSVNIRELWFQDSRTLPGTLRQLFIQEVFLVNLSPASSHLAPVGGKAESDTVFVLEPQWGKVYFHPFWGGTNNWLLLASLAVEQVALFRL